MTGRWLRSPAIRSAVALVVSSLEAFAIPSLVLGFRAVLILVAARGGPVPAVTCGVKPIVVITIVTAFFQAVAIAVLERRGRVARTVVVRLVIWVVAGSWIAVASGDAVHAAIARIALPV